jgi:FkbM family methyltransferase
MVPESFLNRIRALDYRVHSSEEFRLLSQLCNREKISIDIGANQGVLTYFLVRFSLHVYAYEPNPELAAKLQKSFKKKATIIQAALSDIPGAATLKIPSYQGVEMHGLASIGQSFEDADSVKQFSVPKRRLDDEGFKNVGFVKIDVEQHEQEVLRGGMRLFQDQRPNIFLEVTPKLYKKPLQETLSNILKLGYRGYFIYDHALVPLDKYRQDIHNRSENYGVGHKYVTNVVLSTSSLET